MSFVQEVLTEADIVIKESLSTFQEGAQFHIHRIDTRIHFDQSRLGLRDSWANMVMFPLKFSCKTLVRARDSHAFPGWEPSWKVPL